MYTVTVESSFNAEHQLTFAGGQIESLHGHKWIVRAAVSAEKLNEVGLAVDFNDLKKAVEEVIAPLDGAILEKSDCFNGRNVSAEVVAEYIYNHVDGVLGKGEKLAYVEVMEAPGCWAKYSV